MIEDNDDIEKIASNYTLSSLDKLSWPKKIELQLYITIRNFDKGKYGVYDKEVIKLEDCIKENFYGVDFKTPIKQHIAELDEEKEKMRDKWIKELDNGMYYHPVVEEDLTFKDKNLLKRKIYFWYWHSRFEKVRELLASKRGLLWGKRQLPGGQQMERPE